MRFIAGLFMFIGLVGLVAAGDDIVRTRPYGARVTARFDRQTTDLDAELAKRHHRFDKAVAWVDEVASQLSSRR